MIIWCAASGCVQVGVVTSGSISKSHYLNDILVSSVPFAQINGKSFDSVKTTTVCLKKFRFVSAFGMPSISNTITFSTSQNVLIGVYKPNKAYGNYIFWSSAEMGGCAGGGECNKFGSWTSVGNIGNYAVLAR